MVKYNVEIVKTENGTGKPTAGLTTVLVAENGNDNADANGRENGTTGKFVCFLLLLNTIQNYYSISAKSIDLEQEIKLS